MNDNEDNFQAFKLQAEKINNEYPEQPFTKGDIIHDIIFFFVVLAGSFIWAMLMLLIISFVTLSILKFNIEKMVIASILISIVATVVYTVGTTRKYVKLMKNKK